MLNQWNHGGWEKSPPSRDGKHANEASRQALKRLQNAAENVEADHDEIDDFVTESTH